MKVKVVGGKSDFFTYVVQLSRTMPATILISEALLGFEDGATVGRQTVGHMLC